MKLQTRYLGLLTTSQPLPLGTIVAAEDTVDRNGLPIWRRREAKIVSSNRIEVKQLPPLDADVSVRAVRYKLEGKEIENAQLVISASRLRRSILMPDRTLPNRARR